MRIYPKIISAFALFICICIQAKAQLVVYYPDNGAGTACSFKIFLNGKYLGKVKYGDWVAYRIHDKGDGKLKAHLTCAPSEKEISLDPDKEIHYVLVDASLAGKAFATEYSYHSLPKFCRVVLPPPEKLNAAAFASDSIVMHRDTLTAVHEKGKPAKELRCPGYFVVKADTSYVTFLIPARKVDGPANMTGADVVKYLDKTGRNGKLNARDAAQFRYYLASSEFYYISVDPKKKHPIFMEVEDLNTLCYVAVIFHKGFQVDPLGAVFGLPLIETDPVSTMHFTRFLRKPNGELIELEEKISVKQARTRLVNFFRDCEEITSKISQGQLLKKKKDISEDVTTIVTLYNEKCLKELTPQQAQIK